MISSRVRTGLTAVWAALHTTQYGMAITGLNGISDAMTCSVDSKQIGIHSVSAGWLKPCVYMTSAQFGLIVSIFTLGGLAGCLLSDLVTRSHGRIGTLRTSAATILLGSLAVAIANSVPSMIFGRVLVGVGCGLATVTVPLFLAEIAPPSIKRSLGIMNQLFIVFGMLIAQSLSFLWAKPMSWRYVLAVSIVVAVSQLVGSLFVRPTDPEKDQSRGGDEEDRLIPRETVKPLTIRQLITSTDSKIRRGLVVVAVTQLAQQSCGVSPVMYFSTRILKPVFGGNSKLIAILIVIFKVPLTAVPALLIERVGSRPILLFSATVMSASAFVLAFGLNASSGPACVAAILSFVAAFSIGLGPVTWVVLSEVMPHEATTAAGAIGIGLNWTTNFVMGSTFLPLQQWLSGSTESGEGNIFYVICGICALLFLTLKASYAAYDRVAI
ncbi:putative vacuolar membrane protein [Naematelia encephala]|uniref:Putative vacuolar membrane protein n=1 Tax=Naematelia encephala TaxID=71784 RepID=A0A1Y2APR6_9TREE|nr:putative vacuolar membrane protein [Naematelia encephala]